MDGKKLRSPLFWTAIVTQILSILLALNVITLSQQEEINHISASVIQMLVIFGTLSKSTNKSCVCVPGQTTGNVVECKIMEE